jgi:hypothetical protein
MPFAEQPLFDITVPPISAPVYRVTLQMILSRPKVTTEQALAGYDYLKANSKRCRNPDSVIQL